MRGRAWRRLGREAAALCPISSSTSTSSSSASSSASSSTPTATMGDGRSIPMVGLGTYLSDSGDETETSCMDALAQGYRHIDTAQGYDNEASVGRAIVRSGVDRSELFICTKLWPGNEAWGDPEPGFDGVLAACAASLQRLGLSFVDLYLIHAPFSTGKRLEQWRACVELQRRGCCRSVSPPRLHAALPAGLRPHAGEAAPA